MHRTQIYLADEEAAVLRLRSHETGVTRSHLIRAAVRKCYLDTPDSMDVLSVLRATAGAWRACQEEDGATYVERIRGSKRLEQLHAVASRKKRA